MLYDYAAVKLEVRVLPQWEMVTDMCVGLKLRVGAKSPGRNTSDGTLGVSRRQSKDYAKGLTSWPNRTLQKCHAVCSAEVSLCYVICSLPGNRVATRKRHGIDFAFQSFREFSLEPRMKLHCSTSLLRPVNVWRQLWTSVHNDNLNQKRQPWENLMYIYIYDFLHLCSQAQSGCIQLLGIQAWSVN